MESHVNPIWRLLAVIACFALSAEPSLAAGRGKFAPQASQGFSPDGQRHSHNGALPTSHLTDGLTGTKIGVDAIGPASAHPETPDNPPTSANGRSAATTRGIDLVRPDDGYANLRRRAARSSLVSPTQKKPPPVAPLAVTLRPPSPAGATSESARNSGAMPIPAHINAPKPSAVGAVTNEPANTGLARNSLGLSTNAPHHHEIRITAAPFPVTGINGSTMGHAGTTGIGGPTKERSAIGGSARRF
jgi:hypothetical protein